VRTKVLYPAIEKANELLAGEGKPPLPDGITFHSLRRTYAALRAELGEHPAITAAQMGHRDPRIMGHQRAATPIQAVPTPINRRRPKTPNPAPLQAVRETGATGLEPAASGVTGRREVMIFGRSGMKWLR
jgi:hypothetical protein